MIVAEEQVDFPSPLTLDPAMLMETALASRPDLAAADFVSAFQKRQGLYISCIEEIAYKRGFIDKEQLVKLAQPLLKTDYGKYLLEIAEGL